MKKITIHDRLAEATLKAVLIVIRETCFSPFCDIGIRGKEKDDIEVAHFGATILVSMDQEILDYLRNIETKKVASSNKFLPGTPHGISGVQIGDLCVACYMPHCEPYSTAVASVYGLMHQLIESESEPDELSVGTLLSFAESWQKENFPDNKIILPLLHEVLAVEHAFS